MEEVQGRIAEEIEMRSRFMRPVEGEEWTEEEREFNREYDDDVEEVDEALKARFGIENFKGDISEAGDYEIEDFNFDTLPSFDKGEFSLLEEKKALEFGLIFRRMGKELPPIKYLKKILPEIKIRYGKDKNILGVEVREGGGFERVLVSDMKGGFRLRKFKVMKGELLNNTSIRERRFNDLVDRFKIMIRNSIREWKNDTQEGSVIDEVRSEISFSVPPPPPPVVGEVPRMPVPDDIELITSEPQLSVMDNYETVRNVRVITDDVIRNTYFDIDDQMTELEVEIINDYGSVIESGEVFENDDGGRDYSETVNGMFPRISERSWFKDRRRLGSDLEKTYDAEKGIIRKEVENIEERISKENSPEKKKVYEKLKKFLDLRLKKLKLFFNKSFERSEDGDVIEEMREKIRDHNLTRFEKIKSWVRDNLTLLGTNLASVIISVVGTHFTLRAFSQSATDQIKKTFKTLGDEIKRIGRENGKVAAVVLGTLGLLFKLGGEVFKWIEENIFTVIVVVILVLYYLYRSKK